MRIDNSAHLITAARRRHEFTRSKTIQALRELDNAGDAVTFQTVANSAEVSRSWLYTQPDIRAEIERLRDLHRRAPRTAVPADQRATEQSLLRRLETANARNRKLDQDNQRLRRQLAHALGQLRAAGIRAQDPAAGAPSHRTSVTIDPRDRICSWSDVDRNAAPLSERQWCGSF